MTQTTDNQAQAVTFGEFLGALQALGVADDTPLQLLGADGNAVNVYPEYDRIDGVVHLVTSQLLDFARGGDVAPDDDDDAPINLGGLGTASEMFRRPL